MKTGYNACPEATQRDLCTVGESNRAGVRLTRYPVFPGITLIYRDIHAVSQEEEGVGDARVLEIRHCFEGRMEYTVGEDTTASPPATSPSRRSAHARGKRGFRPGTFTVSPSSSTLTARRDAFPAFWKT